MNNLISIIILIIIILIILEVVIFHRMNETQEERDHNIHKLWITILVTVIVAIIIVYLLKDDHREKSGGGEEDDQEYGIFSEGKRNIKNYWARQKAYREAKRAGATDEEAAVKRAEVKQRQKDIKDAERRAGAEEARRQKDARK